MMVTNGMYVYMCVVFNLQRFPYDQGHIRRRYYLPSNRICIDAAIHSIHKMQKRWFCRMECLHTEYISFVSMTQWWSSCPVSYRFRTYWHMAVASVSDWIAIYRSLHVKNIRPLIFCLESHHNHLAHSFESQQTITQGVYTYGIQHTGASHPSFLPACRVSTKQNKKYHNPFYFVASSFLKIIKSKNR